MQLRVHILNVCCHGAACSTGLKLLYYNCLTNLLAPHFVRKNKKELKEMWAMQLSLRRLIRGEKRAHQPMHNWSSESLALHLLIPRWVRQLCSQHTAPYIVWIQNDQPAFMIDLRRYLSSHEEPKTLEGFVTRPQSTNQLNPSHFQTLGGRKLRKHGSLPNKNGMQHPS